MIDPEIGAIIMSGNSFMPIMTNYKDHGFQGRLIKPFTVAELSETLDNIFAED